MAIAIDTNVIIDVIAGDDAAAQQATAALTQHSAQTGLVISPMVYAELFAHPSWGSDDIHSFLTGTAISVQWQLGQSIWETAGVAFAGYARRRSRHREALPRRLLPDFLIGAHAMVVGALLTSDVQFYRTNFPELHLLAL